MTCQEVNAGKESPKIYLESAKRLNASADEVVIFEARVTRGMYRKDGRVLRGGRVRMPRPNRTWTGLKRYVTNTCSHLTMWSVLDEEGSEHSGL